MGSKPLIAFIGEGFESVQELKHLKGSSARSVERRAVFQSKVFLSHCALKLKKSGTIVPRMELVEVGPSMDLVVRRHRLPNEALSKEAMKIAPELTKKKVKNVKGDPILGKTGRVYIPDQKVGDMALPNKAKGVKRERREEKKIKDMNGEASKKQKGELT